MEFGKQYLTITEYKILGGTLSKDAFNLLEFEARKKIDKETFGRLIKISEQVNDVKLCMFKLIGVLNENKSTIISEGIDGCNITRLEKKELETVKNTIIREYLSECKLDDGTPYLYRGGVRRNQIC